MYPNPLFGDELTIVLEGYKRNSMVQLDITTAYGKVVLTQQAKVTKDNIMLKDEALEQLAPGVYFVSLRSNDIVKTQTLVVY